MDGALLVNGSNLKSYANSDLPSIKQVLMSSGSRSNKIPV